MRIVHSADGCDFDVDIVMQCVKIRQDRHQPLDRDAGQQLDAQRALVLRAHCIVNHGFKPVEQLRATDRNLLPDGGKGNIPSVSLNDRHAEFFLELAELMTDGTWRDVKPVCGPSHAARPVHRVKHAQRREDISQFVHDR